MGKPRSVPFSEEFHIHFPYCLERFLIITLSKGDTFTMNAEAVLPCRKYFQIHCTREKVSKNKPDSVTQWLGHSAGMIEDWILVHVSKTAHVFYLNTL